MMPDHDEGFTAFGSIKKSMFVYGRSLLTRDRASALGKALLVVSSVQRFPTTSTDRKYEKMTMEIITEKRVRLKALSRDWEDALTMCIQLLVDNGYVELAYIQATINAVKNYGPYIVLAPGIAFAHAKPADGVKSTGISLLTLEKAVYFGHQDNDPVDIVIGIAALDFNLHVEIMRKLAMFLSNAENIDFIQNAINVRDIVKRINQ